MSKVDRTVNGKRDLGQCNGEVLFGFTVKACDQPATMVLRNDQYDEYQFCRKHFILAKYGKRPGCSEIMTE